jgi:5-formyltetrahydrofolate cyclo-ligase
MALTTKTACRTWATMRRDALTIIEREEKTRITLKHLAEWLQSFHAHCMGLYLPIRSEMSPLGLINCFNESSFTVPYIRDHDMAFALWDKNTPMKQGFGGISEPLHPYPAQPDIIITPLLAVDRHGTRLGYGKGYYDRYFASDAGKDAQRIGIAFACQLSERSLPRDAHDQPLHALVTEEGVIRFD